ncbi:unnamed protein product [Amoebophrya sp. A25]|nr:unnamed protein product [Amoebophrya sp. A25]|eukprot:GSA25T00014234001.1
MSRGSAAKLTRLPLVKLCKRPPRNSNSSTTRETETVKVGMRLTADDVARELGAMHGLPTSAMSSPQGSSGSSIETFQLPSRLDERHGKQRGDFSQAEASWNHVAGNAALAHVDAKPLGSGAEGEKGSVKQDSAPAHRRNEADDIFFQSGPHAKNHRPECRDAVSQRHAEGAENCPSSCSPAFQGHKSVLEEYHINADDQQNESWIHSNTAGSILGGFSSCSPASSVSVPSVTSSLMSPAAKSSTLVESKKAVEQNAGPVLRTGQGDATALGQECGSRTAAQSGSPVEQSSVSQVESSESTREKSWNAKPSSSPPMRLSSGISPKNQTSAAPGSVSSARTSTSVGTSRANKQKEDPLLVATTSLMGQSSQTSPSAPKAVVEVPRRKSSQARALDSVNKMIRLQQEHMLQQQNIALSSGASRSSSSSSSPSLASSSKLSSGSEVSSGSRIGYEKEHPQNLYPEDEGVGATSRSCIVGQLGPIPEVTAEEFPSCSSSEDGPSCSTSLDLPMEPSPTLVSESALADIRDRELAEMRARQRHEAKKLQASSPAPIDLIPEDCESSYKSNGTGASSSSARPSPSYEYQHDALSLGAGEEGKAARSFDTDQHSGENSACLRVEYHHHLQDVNDNVYGRGGPRPYYYDSGVGRGVGDHAEQNGNGQQRAFEPPDRSWHHNQPTRARFSPADSSQVPWTKGPLDHVQRKYPSDTEPTPTLISDAEKWYRTVRERVETDLADALRCNGRLVEELSRRSKDVETLKDLAARTEAACERRLAAKEADCVRKSRSFDTVIADLQHRFDLTKQELEVREEAMKRVCQTQCETLRDELSASEKRLRESHENADKLKAEIAYLRGRISENRDISMKTLQSVQDVVVASAKQAQTQYKEWKSQQKTQWPLDKVYFSRLEDTLRSVELRCTRLLRDTEKRFQFLAQRSKLVNTWSDHTDISVSVGCAGTTSTAAGAAKVADGAQGVVDHLVEETPLLHSHVERADLRMGAENKGTFETTRETENYSLTTIIKRTPAVTPTATRPSRSPSVRNNCLNLFLDLDDSILSEQAAHTYLDGIVANYKERNKTSANTRPTRTTTSSTGTGIPVDKGGGSGIGSSRGQKISQLSDSSVKRTYDPSKYMNT